MARTRPLVIIHGWSDNSRSFQKLASLCQSELKRKPTFINLADYITMDDDITFADLAAGMHKAWQQHKLPETPHSVDVIAHSAGALVTRTWLVRYYKGATAPIKHLVFLAPANFGSHLAHKGRAFFGRVIKGAHSKKIFNTGTQLLYGLELASPETYDLARHDVLGKERYYGPDRILCTVLVGNSGYKGIFAAANEIGTDGTVRISTANLNCALLTADFNTDPEQPSYTIKTADKVAAFTMLDKENHSTIAGKAGGFNNSDTFPFIKQGLEIEDKDFNSWRKQLAQYSSNLIQTNSNNIDNHSLQNTVFFVHDQFNFHVSDYFLEFFMRDKNAHWFAQHFHNDVIRTVHAYKPDNAYRSIYIDCHRLKEKVEPKWDHMSLSLTAMPNLDNKRHLVGYRTYASGDIGAIDIPRDKLDAVFAPNRTLLVDITLRREQADEVFQLQRA